MKIDSATDLLIASIWIIIFMIFGGLFGSVIYIKMALKEGVVFSKEALFRSTSEESAIQKFLIGVALGSTSIWYLFINGALYTYLNNSYSYLSRFGIENIVNIKLFDIAFFLFFSLIVLSFALIILRQPFRNSSKRKKLLHYHAYFSFLSIYFLMMGVAFSLAILVEKEYIASLIVFAVFFAIYLFAMLQFSITQIRYDEEKIETSYLWHKKQIVYWNDIIDWRVSEKKDIHYFTTKSEEKIEISVYLSNLLEFFEMVKKKNITFSDE